MVRPRTFVGALLVIWPLIVSSLTFNPLSDSELVPGQVITLNWKPSSNGKISLNLIESDNLNETLISDTNNIGAYTWTVPADILLDREYVISINYDGDTGDNAAYTDTFWIYSSSHLASASSSLISATTGGPSESTTIPISAPLPSIITDISSGPTTMSISAPTTLTTAVPSSVNAPDITAIATGILSPPSSSPSNTPDQSNNGLSPSNRTALIACLALGIPLACLGMFLLFAKYTRRYPRSENPDERKNRTFFQWFIRPHSWSSGPESPLDKTGGKRITGVESDFLNSPTTSQGLRSSQATQDSGMWHHKPELPGSDPVRESSTPFLAPVELPAWGPDELDSSVQVEAKGQRKVNEKGDVEMGA